MAKSQQDQDWEDYQLGQQGTDTGSLHNQQGLNDRKAAGGGGGGGSSCFPRGTKVLTPHGWANIEKLNVGDRVYSINNSDQLIPRCIKARKDHSKTSIIAVHTDNNHILRVTPNHTVLTETGWKKVSKLRSGDQLYEVSKDGTKRVNVITEINKEKEVEPVHNLIIEGSYTFITDGCVAHSFTFMRGFRVALYTAFDSLCENCRKAKQKCLPSCSISRVNC